MGTMFIKTSRKTRLRWLDQVEEDLKKMKMRNWREKCKDRRLCNEIVKQAKTHQRRLKKKKKPHKRICNQS
jgi:hypothetical protein